MSELEDAIRKIVREEIDKRNCEPASAVDRDAVIEECARVARSFANDFMRLRRDETDIWRDGGMAYEMLKGIRSLKSPLVKE